MRIRHPRVFVGVIVGLLFGLASIAHAEDPTLRVARLFSDNMVLQQEKPIRIWGFDVPGTDVTVTFNSKSQTATADGNGAWRVSLPAMKADGKKHTLTIKGSTTITLRNVVLGEVWICSGQSNMEWGAGPALCKDADHPDLRLFCAGSRRIPLKADLALPTGWAECRPDTLELGGSKVFDDETGSIKRIKPFTRVGYQFGRDLHKDLGVPVGLVQVSMGGSIMASWTPDEAAARDFPFGKEMSITERKMKRHPGALYHLIVRPVTPLSVRGVIWFQGESDADNPEFEKQLREMITIWRKAFDDPGMHFYMVQLAASSWRGGMLGAWEAQRRVAGQLPNCGIAVINDIYPPDKFCSVDEETGWLLQGRLDPHPPNTHIIAGRLANICLQKVYSKTTKEAYGPMYRSHVIKGDKVVITFDHVGEGLKSADDEPLNWFEVSDGSRKEDGPYVYVKAIARVIGKNQIEVHSTKVASPKYVRFSWHMYARHNLVNSEDLPAFPFRTDDYADPRAR